MQEFKYISRYVKGSTNCRTQEKRTLETLLKIHSTPFQKEAVSYTAEEGYAFQMLKDSEEEFFTMRTTHHMMDIWA